MLGHVAVRLWMLGGLGGLLVLGLPEQLERLWVFRYVPLAEEAVEVGLFLAACLVYWRLGYRLDRAVRWQVEQDLMLAGQPVRAGWNAREHLAFHFRHNFLFVAIPVGLIMLRATSWHW